MTALVSQSYLGTWALWQIQRPRNLERHGHRFVFAWVWGDCFVAMGSLDLSICSTNGIQMKENCSCRQGRSPSTTFGQFHGLDSPLLGGASPSSLAATSCNIAIWQCLIKVNESPQDRNFFDLPVAGDLRFDGQCLRARLSWHL